MEPLKKHDQICYCFGYTIADIETDALANSRSLILEKIVAEKKGGGCNCSEKNPKGRWCISDVRQVADKILGKGDSLMKI